MLEKASMTSRLLRNVVLGTVVAVGSGCSSAPRESKPAEAPMIRRDAQENKKGNDTVTFSPDSKNQNLVAQAGSSPISETRPNKKVVIPDVEPITEDPLTHWYNESLYVNKKGKYPDEKGDQGSRVHEFTVKSSDASSRKVAWTEHWQTYKGPEKLAISRIEKHESALHVSGQIDEKVEVFNKNKKLKAVYESQMTRNGRALAIHHTAYAPTSTGELEKRHEKWEAVTKEGNELPERYLYNKDTRIFYQGKEGSKVAKLRVPPNTMIELERNETTGAGERYYYYPDGFKDGKGKRVLIGSLKEVYEDPTPVLHTGVDGEKFEEFSWPVQESP